MYSLPVKEKSPALKSKNESKLKLIKMGILRTLPKNIISQFDENDKNSAPLIIKEKKVFEEMNNEIKFQKTLRSFIKSNIESQVYL